MRPWWQRMAGLAVVIALVGTPSVVAACAFLCLPFTAHHGEASAPAEDDATRAAQMAHVDCHGSQAADASPAPEVVAMAGTPAGAVTLGARDDHECCPDTLGLPSVSTSASRASTDQVTPPPAALVHVGHRTALARPRGLARSGPSPHPASAASRLPLVLRI